MRKIIILLLFLVILNLVLIIFSFYEYKRLYDIAFYLQINEIEITELEY